MCPILAEFDGRVSYSDFLLIAGEFWYSREDDRHLLEGAFETLDPGGTSTLLVKDFTELLRTCDWSEDEIELLLSEVSCISGYIYCDGKMTSLSFV